MKRVLTNMTIIVLGVVLLIIISYENKDKLNHIKSVNQLDSIQRETAGGETMLEQPVAGIAVPTIAPSNTEASYEYVNNMPCYTEKVELPCEDIDLENGTAIKMYVKLEDYYVSQQIPEEIDDVENVYMDDGAQLVSEREVDSEHRVVVAMVKLRNPNEHDVDVCLGNINLKYNLTPYPFELAYHNEKRYATSVKSSNIVKLKANEEKEYELLYTPNIKYFRDYDMYLVANLKGTYGNDGSWAVYKLDLSEWIK